MDELQQAETDLAFALAQGDANAEDEAAERIARIKAAREDWGARADREAARIVAALEATTNVRDYARVQQVAALAWLEGYKAASSDALEAMTK